MVRPDVQVMKTSRWTFHSTPFLLLTFHHTTYHSGDHNSDHAGKHFDEDHAADNVDEDHAANHMMKIKSLTILMKITPQFIANNFQRGTWHPHVQKHRASSRSPTTGPFRILSEQLHLRPFSSYPTIGPICSVLPHGPVCISYHMPCP